jgi:hypothetical protein
MALSLTHSRYVRPWQAGFWPYVVAVSCFEFWLKLVPFVRRVGLRNDAGAKRRE